MNGILQTNQNNQLELNVMIIGPDSIKKFGILAALVVAGVVDFIAAMNNVVVARINAAVIALGL